MATAPIRNGCVAVGDDGRIAFVGPASDAPPAAVTDLGETILTPGLVNTHTHLDLTPLRGRIPNRDFFRWIRALTALKKSHMSQELLAASSIMGVAEGVRCGVTTFADTSDTDAPFSAMVECGVRGVAYQEVFAPNPVDAGAVTDSLQRRLDALSPRASNRVKLGVSPHAPYSVSDALYRGCVAVARDRGLPIATHIAESAAESEYVVKGSGPFATFLTGRGISVRPRGTSPLSLLLDNGVLDLKPLLIHAVRIGGSDIELIAASGSGVAHCPVSNSRLGHGVAPLSAILNAGIATGLGTDSVITNNRMDPLDEARLAAILQRAMHPDGEELGSTRLLGLLTRGGATALGLGDEIGTLEVGRWGDLAGFDISGVHTVPLHDPSETLLHSVRGSDATFAAVAGVELLRDSRLLFDVTDAERVVREGAARFPSIAAAEQLM